MAERAVRSTNAVMIGLKPLLGGLTLAGLLCLVLAHAWATRAIEPQLAQDVGTYCRNWQAQLNVKISDFNSTCTGLLDRTSHAQCGKWREDLDSQTARFNRRCPG